MDKMKGSIKNLSIKKSFALYVISFALVAILLIMVTAALCQKAIAGIQASYPVSEEWFYLATQDGELLDEQMKVWKSATSYSSMDETVLSVLNAVIYLSMPFYFIICLFLATSLFYKNKMKKPLALLNEAQDMISNHNFNFSIEYPSNDEMGRLCDSFEKMRVILLENTNLMMRQMDQRKRLNAAFAHDLRTPLTVIKGYAEILLQEDNTRTTKEKAITMCRHIGRLERYVENMSSLQKLDDIEPSYTHTDLDDLSTTIHEIAKFVCDDAHIHLNLQSKMARSEAVVDGEIVLGVIENLVSNAVRYAKSKISIELDCDGDWLQAIVEDDGTGFSQEAVQRAAEPFYTGDSSRTDHFGLGLYICSVMCERHGGSLKIENSTGAKVTASFRIRSR